MPVGAWDCITVFDIAEGLSATSCGAPEGEQGDHFIVVIRGIDDLDAIVAEGGMWVVCHLRDDDGSVAVCGRFERYDV